MNFRNKSIKLHVNSLFFNLPVNRTSFENFKEQFIKLINSVNFSETEEYNKNNIRDFIANSLYQSYIVNTSDRIDLAIYSNREGKHIVSVIIEVKSPSNKAEMITQDNFQKKAFYELLLYYLREKITNENHSVESLIITNSIDWYIFDSRDFERVFARNHKLINDYKNWYNGHLDTDRTQHFYDNIAKVFVENSTDTLDYVHFSLDKFVKSKGIGTNRETPDDDLLFELKKLLSPEHLLRIPFANDSNSLDKRFYSELLHIIGLTETKEGSKKLIERNKEGERNSGSILEDAIIQLDSLDKLSRLEKPNQFGNTQQERLFNVALELSITWINRILFLKLLEAQLITYHKGDKSYSFLNFDKIKNYDDLNSLFFQVLARKYDERNEDVKKVFEKTPYLNSSLFEPTDMEQVTLFISNLKDDKTIPIFSQTVLKDQHGKKRTGNISTLPYLFEFLDAYDFGAEGGSNIQEDNKTLINASVLGLIFEKINGYKDGSFFTPGFITMYMCRETIRKAVVQKFNETKKWNCTTLEELYDKIEDRKEANKIVNSIKICDPAVGSGHFLVSALNEMIAVKNDLKILQDRDGKRLKEYQVEVVNDVLIVTDEEGELFEYNPSNKESQRIQETLFHEKQTIIENCLFGVDINSNSVKICRLRLWIELLKNAYYKNSTELETLPNIDINIKCGNSLVSRFAIDADLKQALKKSKWTIDSYRIAVDTYRNAESKEQKREMERLIADIKSDFRSEISRNDPKVVKLRKLSGELFNMTNQGQLFEMSKKEKAAWNKKVQQLTEETQKIETEIEEIKANKIFENAFEWRFEFPEVLNDDGDFVGFDVVIGNPPYILVQTLGDQNIFNYYSQTFKAATYKIDTYALFYELGISLLSTNSLLCFITPNTFLKNKHSKELRQLILSNSLVEIINFYTQVFEDASVDTLILMLSKNNQPNPNSSFVFSAYRKNVFDLFETEKVYHLQGDFIKGNYELELDIDTILRKLLTKIEYDTKPLSFYGRSYFGIQTFDRKEFVSKTKIDDNYYPVIDGGNIKRYRYEPNTEFVSFKKESIKSGGDPLVYKKHRIVVRQIGVFPEGTIVEPNIMTLNTIYNIYLHNEDIHSLRFLLSLINSKLFQFYWLKKHYDNKATFPKIKKEPIESFPIKDADTKTIKKHSELVLEILAKKSQDNSSDTTALETQIDQMVYELYELTEEEIKIIENK